MDFYGLLGLTRAASAGDIERAFRRLSRRHHPGINPGDRVAEDLYRQIQEAYRVLGDADRRRVYDRGDRVSPDATIVTAAVSFEGFDFSAVAEGPRAATFSEMFADVFQHAARRATGADRDGLVEVELTVPFEDAMRGGTFPVSVARQGRCGACGGDGRQTRQTELCSACDGTGVRRWARGHMVFTAPCERCAGEGHIASQACRLCGGAGVAPRSEVLSVTLPPGVEHGARVVVPGRGHVSPCGGPIGDAHVHIVVAPHRFFRREGRDLHVALPVAVHEAALGATVEVPTLDGPASLRVPPGTASGTRVRLRGRGVPAVDHTSTAGDLVADVHIVLPPMTERSRELLRELGRVASGDVRAHLFGRWDARGD